MGALISLAVLGYIIYKVIRFFDNYKKYKEIAENMSNNVEVPKEEIPQYDYSSKVNETYKVKQSEAEKKADKTIKIPQEDYEDYGFQYNNEKSFEDNVDDYYMEYGGVDDYDGSAPWGCSKSSSSFSACYDVDFGSDFETSELQKKIREFSDYTLDELIQYCNRKIFKIHEFDEDDKKLIINWFSDKSIDIYKDYLSNYEYQVNPGFTFSDLDKYFKKDINILAEYGIKSFESIQNIIKDKILNYVFLEWPSEIDNIENYSKIDLCKSLYNLAVFVYKYSILTSNYYYLSDYWKFQGFSENISIDPDLFNVPSGEIKILNSLYKYNSAGSDWYDSECGEIYHLLFTTDNGSELSFNSDCFDGLLELWNEKLPNKFIEYMAIPLIKDIIHESKLYQDNICNYTIAGFRDYDTFTELEKEEKRLSELYCVESTGAGYLVREYIYPNIARYFFYCFNKAIDINYNYYNFWLYLKLDNYGGKGIGNIRCLDEVPFKGKIYEININLYNILDSGKYSNDYNPEYNEAFY